MDNYWVQGSTGSVTRSNGHTHDLWEAEGSPGNPEYDEQGRFEEWEEKGQDWGRLRKKHFGPDSVAVTVETGGNKGNSISIGARLDSRNSGALSNLALALSQLKLNRPGLNTRLVITSDPVNRSDDPKPIFDGTVLEFLEQYF